MNERRVMPSVVEAPGRMGGALIVPPPPRSLDYARDDGALAL